MSLLKTGSPRVTKDTLNGSHSSMVAHLRRYIDSAVRNGWNEDPEHTPIKHPERIEEFLGGLATIISKGVPEPAVHPTMEGDVTARWSSGDRIINLTAYLDSMTAELYYRERSTGTRSIETLDLKADEIWDIVKTQVVTAYPNA